MQLRKAIIIVIMCAAKLACTQDKSANIIFIITDDQRWDALGYAGNDIIKTPEMDKLAAEGTYFANAFVTTPICAASRASMMTGLYERKHDYTFRQPPLNDKLIDQSYFSLLKNAGYYNGYLGKFGVKFNDRRDTSLFDIYKPEGANFYYRLVGATKHQHLTNLMGERAVEFIHNAPEDRPFCLTVSYNAPHAEDSSPDQYIWPAELDEMYEDVRIPTPPMSADSDFDRLPEDVKAGFNRVRWKWRFDSAEKHQQMVKGYYRMISAIDRTIKDIRDELAEKGIDDNTMIILIGDNGYFLGERQLAGKWLMYEPSLRVPLIIYNPKGTRKTINDMVLNIDVTPTILDVAGVSIPEEYQGKSLVNYTKDAAEVPEKREAFLCEHLWDFENIPASEGIRTERYKYFRYVNNPSWEELYDHWHDPEEKNNLATKKEFNDVLAMLRTKCDEMIEEAR